MSFLDKVKSATGMGLNPDESYHRAFEKGVLLGNYDAASEMFEKAAQKFEEVGQTEKARRARANQYLYAFATKKDPAIIDRILPHLRTLQDIEALGSETEHVSAPELTTELEARKFENAAFASAHSSQDAINFHGMAADLFEKILKAELKTYKMVPAADHNHSAEERFFLHRGHAAYDEALLLQDSDPIAAGDKINEAALAFKRAKDERLRGKMEAIASNLRIKRTCWFCHREMQGMGLNVDYYKARITQYSSALAGKLGQDLTTLDRDRQVVAVCLPCASMIQQQADNFALARTEELRKEVVTKLNAMFAAINALSERVSRVERTRR